MKKMPFLSVLNIQLFHFGCQTWNSNWTESNGSLSLSLFLLKHIWRLIILFSTGLGPPAPPGPADNHPRVHPMNSMMPYIPTDSSDSDYSHIYGRLPIPTRGIRKFPAKPLFLSHWEWWIEIHPQPPTKSGKQKIGPKKSQSRSRLFEWEMKLKSSP
jgi:hypothetical protein